MGKAVRLKWRIADLQQQIIYLNRKLDLRGESMADYKALLEGVIKENEELKQEVENLEDAHSNQKAM